MEALGGLLIGTQLVFTVIAGLYFYTNLKSQQSSKTTIHQESKREMEKMKKLRSIHLTQPLSEKTRPENFAEIIGQEKGIKALRAAICGPNPQHVIIYGPPGVGKTAAARLMLKSAVESGNSPFHEDSPFIEMDATILQFDERSIADPLIGSVHDPIYQGAGAFGPAGVPQPKAGAVTKAHGGILFIDEIGELHPVQMNKLLKVLEDRKVFLSSSYYTKDDPAIPRHIRDVFDNGLPADFRLIGATTRPPEALPPALRSRCAEVYFRSLHTGEVRQIATNACVKAGFTFEPHVPEYISRYASNGRDTVNIVQTAASLSLLDERKHIRVEDTEEVIEYGHYSPNFSKKIAAESKIGMVNGLAVVGASSGTLLEIEAVARAAEAKKGVLKVTGIVEEEEIQSPNGHIKRVSTVRSSVENVLTMIGRYTGCEVRDYDIHLNFPGGIPIDGPSAGVAVFMAIYSALTGKSVSPKIAMTGEVTLHGRIHPVGGVPAKIEAAVEAGVERIFIPKANDQKAFSHFGISVISVDTIDVLLAEVFKTEEPVTHTGLGLSAEGLSRAL